jgi:hypothetical protein
MLGSFRNSSNEAAPVCVYSCSLIQRNRAPSNFFRNDCINGDIVGGSGCDGRGATGSTGAGVPFDGNDSFVFRFLWGPDDGLSSNITALTSLLPTGPASLWTVGLWFATIDDASNAKQRCRNEGRTECRSSRASSFPMIAWRESRDRARFNLRERENLLQNEGEPLIVSLNLMKVLGGPFVIPYIHLHGGIH